MFTQILPEDSTLEQASPLSILKEHINERRELKNQKKLLHERTHALIHCLCHVSSSQANRLVPPQYSQLRMFSRSGCVKHSI